jgi:prophage antirepressor-like protein
MNKKEAINKMAIFEGQEIRKKAWKGEWFFSVVDVVAALTDSENPRDYWYKMKIRIKLDDGVELSTLCRQLRLQSADGKYYMTDVANTEILFRIIQSIPSPKAEPFKRWLAKVGKERLDEIEQPGKAIERAKTYYLLKGYDPRWVQTRVASIESRGQFTDSLKESGITEGKEFAILTNEMYKATFDLNAQEYKSHKGLDKTDSLRDNMTPLELASTIFSEATATEFMEKADAKGFWEAKGYILKAGNITKDAIKKIEAETGKKVVTKQNYKHLNLPDKQKEIIRHSLVELESNNESQDELSDFDESLKGLLHVPPSSKVKPKE